MLLCIGKPVSKRFFNGEDFHYYIECYQNEPSGKTHIEYVISYTPSVKIGLLQNDSSYSFHIHSANKEGISVGYEIIVIDERNKIEPAPKGYQSCSHELGYYNLSWSNIDVSDVNYTVFWCAGRKPSYCDGPIQWSETIFKVSTFAVEVTDVMLNFQFAVAATNKGQSSGMQWASCIVPSKAPLGQIPITHIEPFSTALRVMWKLDCDAQKSVIDRYVITYCREGRSYAIIAESDAQSYTLKNLHPFSNYSIKLRAFNKDNKPSEDVDEIYQATLSGDPSDSPQNVSVFSRSNSTLGIKWTPPLEPNGIITHYYIYHNELRQFMKDNSSCKICSFIIKNLEQYENYDVSVQACVGDHCSKKSEIVKALTDVG
ncbi:hypothetical protein CEXT_312491 [Caerostris extrusa]|uniref:Fibronectin type-III domain-containing protein n=1 Tax=Caerostris extrusa TaxID=172846 RepID=A0AAV4RLT0_CAEEX|nr:hypothetical protein CEXT_312491 [Caerostris extrusa]